MECSRTIQQEAVKKGDRVHLERSKSDCKYTLTDVRNILEFPQFERHEKVEMRQQMSENVLS
jgi:sortase (surface protein transpeptidase)